ncbi:hypothetical protein BCR37DRAFT_378665 [Protomyces lactucae-debilis]|uniref:Uncharacterized protein n=1 Tax=Protomyces lactucae-debilis TaxID=2754530 RepID=A0A1Y2FJC3_PROLT|nr:uncharacterized protein BCR37DRAFT_378665 [Protomyces lactucae-debilis]ORY83697.1 hypothetical protein BCR37DRAFT_378665 [Protomyces lactucae-debilis]
MSKAVEAQEDKEQPPLPPPPAYDGPPPSVPIRDTKRPLQDSHDAASYAAGPSSASTSTSARSYGSSVPLTSLHQPATNLTSRANRRDITHSLSSLYLDILTHPTPATCDVFKTILDTCVRAGISLKSISSVIQGRDPIYWMTVDASKMPGTLQVLLSQRNALVAPTRGMLRQAVAATLVHDDLQLYKLIRARMKQDAPSTVRWLEEECDDVSLILTESPNLGFLASIKCVEFGKRLQTQRTVEVRFVCRHREWVLQLGQDVYAGLAAISTPAGSQSKEAGIKLMMQSGEMMGFRAQIRLRHPQASMESPFIALGKIQQPREPQPDGSVAWCGPVPFNKHRDWKALVFGESPFFGVAGMLEMQLHVQAVEEQAGECIIQ